MKENGFTLKKARNRQYLAETIIEADNGVDITLLANTPTQAKCLLHSLEQAAGGIGHHVNADKVEYMCFNQEGGISILNGGAQKLEEKFTYLGNSVSFTENDISMHQAKSWTAIDRLLIIWKSDKIKCNFFQAAVVSILLYGCTTWMLTKHIKKELDRNCTRMLWVILNKSWKQYFMKQQL